MMRPSFERLDYLLRANKHIERKLVFDTLARAHARFDLSGHTYLGFGSMWFGDFRPAHKILKIDKLVSVEREPHAERAAFNRPYGCIEVVAGDFANIVRSFSPEQWAVQYIAWLDFDGKLDQTLAGDLAFFVERCAANSVVIVTLNAERNAYRNRDAKLREHTSVGTVEKFLGSGFVAPRFEPARSPAGVFQDLEPLAFPEFLADALLSFLSHKVTSSAREVQGSPQRFVPLFNIGHKDGAEMVTIGGVVTSAVAAGNWESLSAVQGHIRLDLIPITIKEKLVLDSCLPHALDGYLERARDAGICISDEEIAKYQKFYRQFPVFVESVL